MLRALNLALTNVVNVVTCFFSFCGLVDIDSLLTTLKSLSSHEEDEDLKILEDMLKSNTFKKAKHVSGGDRTDVGACVMCV